MLTPHQAHSQIYSVEADDAIAASYFIDTTLITDTNYADTVYFFNDSIHFDSLTAPGYRVITDSVRTKDSTWSLRDNNYFDNDLETIVYFSIIEDTIFYNRASIIKPDSIFIFHIHPDKSDTTKGQLTARHPFDTNNHNFEWFKYDSLTGDFSIPIQNDTNIRTSSISDLASGGYKINISGTQPDTSFHAWVFNDYHHIYIGDDFKDSTGKLYPHRHPCSKIELGSTKEANQFIFFDHYEDTSIVLDNKTTYSWFKREKENPSNIEPLKFSSRPTVILRDNLPSKDHYFIVSAKDNYGNKSRDSVLCESIIPEAKFSAFYKESKDDENKAYEEAPVDALSSGSSPLRTIFIDESINAARTTFFMGDDYQVKNFEEDIGYTGQDPHDSSHIYLIPDKYSIELIAISSENCTDTLRGEEMIEVVPSEIQELPNVFSPNGDGINDYFKIKKENFNSLKYFEILIYNASGNLVYEFNGDINSWEGWDGKIRESNRIAQPGIYYYYIKASGWEQQPAVNYDGKKYSGFLYLFKDKN